MVPARQPVAVGSPPGKRPRTRESRESLGDQPGQRSAPRAPDPAPSPDPGPVPGSGTPGATDEAPAQPQPQPQPQPSAPAAPASPWPGARAVPSPTREPDGSWSSPLTPKPARRPLGPTQARYGRAGGPGFQPTRSDQPGPRGADIDGPGLSPWQRSHRLWTEAGIEWERRPAPQLPWHPTASRSAAPHPRPSAPRPSTPRPAAGQPAGARQVSPARPPAPPRHAQGPPTRQPPRNGPSSRMARAASRRGMA